MATATPTRSAEERRKLKKKPRGRQNVVFEMGFFFGAPGRGHVAVLLDEDVEEPGDIKGLVYV
ncbi:TIR domain-containing protein [Arthrobacter sp. ZGTC131]|uniref:TIR domain-containing protein n=1 Tax=Arthrobacter sp. ZGTC131 TaxID=2058898 RepID=UPI000CE4E5F7